MNGSAPENSGIHIAMSLTEIDVCVSPATISSISKIASNLKASTVCLNNEVVVKLVITKVFNSLLFSGGQPDLGISMIGISIWNLCYVVPCLTRVPVMMISLSFQTFG